MRNRAHSGKYAVLCLVTIVLAVTFFLKLRKEVLQSVQDVSGTGVPSAAVSPSAQGVPSAGNPTGTQVLAPAQEDIGAAEPDAMPVPEGFEEARYIRAVDGDTLVVERNGEEIKVRLIGIDTPESVAPREYLDRTGRENTERGVKASEYTSSLLDGTEYLYLQRDVSDTDRYGRLLRYVWLEPPKDSMNAAEVAEKMLNAVLIKAGVAEIAPYKPDTAYISTFEYIRDMSSDSGFYDGE